MKFEHSDDPENGRGHTERYDHYYTRFAPLYDWLVKSLPVWGNWIGTVIPWIQGPRVLEISFGTGYLLTQYAGQFEVYGIDYNQRMVYLAKDNLRQAGLKASLQVADVEELPYPADTFDTILNTMAFTGYLDGQQALLEMKRVLRPGGRIVMVDISYPKEGNWLGTVLTNAWRSFGDIIRDMPALFDQFGFDYSDREIGGYGSVHLYIANKPA